MTLTAPLKGLLKTINSRIIFVFIVSFVLDERVIYSKRGSHHAKEESYFFKKMEDFFSCNCNVEFINSATKTRA